MAATTCTAQMEVTEANPVLPEPSDGVAEEETPAAETQGDPEVKTRSTSENIWGSFLKSSGLSKVMGGKKKKESVSTDTQGDTLMGESAPQDQEANLTRERLDSGTTETELEKQEDEEASQEQKATSGKDVKPKQSERSGVRSLIRMPVPRIFSHRSTEKPQKHKKTRSRSLDRLEDAGAAEESQTVTKLSDADEDKEMPQDGRHVKRWHSFKKIMAYKSVRKNGEEVKGLDAEDTQCDSGTLDHSGNKKWKLKRSWTFQGLKRDPSITGFHKAKPSSNAKEESYDEAEQGTVAPSQEPEEHAEGDEEKGTKSIDHHPGEIWTSFKKRVSHKSKKPDEQVAANDEEQAGDGEPVEEEGKSTKHQKKMHFGRAVSLKNFLLRKSKGSSMEINEQKDGDQENPLTAGSETQYEDHIPEPNTSVDPKEETSSVELPLSQEESADPVSDQTCSSKGPSQENGSEIADSKCPSAEEEAQQIPTHETKAAAQEAIREKETKAADCCEQENKKGPHAEENHEEEGVTVGSCSLEPQSEE